MASAASSGNSRGWTERTDANAAKESRRTLEALNGSLARFRVDRIVFPVERYGLFVC